MVTFGLGFFVTISVSVIVIIIAICYGQRKKNQMRFYQQQSENTQKLLAEVQISCKKLQELYERAQSAKTTLQISVAKQEETSSALQARLLVEEKKIALLQDKHDQLLEQKHNLNLELTKKEVTLNESARVLKMQKEQFQEQKEALSKSFEFLANNILKEKVKSFQENSKNTLDTILSPFQKVLSDFQKEVKEIHQLETIQQGALRNELKHLVELNQKVSKEANTLSTVLRGQKKTQGNWGELVLETVLEKSGLRAGKEYKTEVSFNTEEGSKRPDIVIYLPQNKHIIIDAKVSLNAYEKFINSTEKSEREKAIKAHTKAIRERIKELSNKQYHKIEKIKSPAIVFMFIPIESAFIEAMKADEHLALDAINAHVLVATPTTLLTSLNIVRQLWHFENQNNNISALIKKADAVFLKLKGFLENFEKIKKSLDLASDAYLRAERQLTSGRGNLIKQVNDLKSITPIKSELPTTFVEKAELELPDPDQPTEQPTP